MANEPQRPVEKLLRTYTEKRRQELGPPFVLDPVKRKILQNEVARTYPAKVETPPARLPSWLTALWPRVAWAGSLLIGLALATALYVYLQPRPTPKLQIAQQQPTAEYKGPGQDEKSQRSQQPPGLLERQSVRLGEVATAPKRPSTVATNSGAASGHTDDSTHYAEDTPARTRSLTSSKPVQADARAGHEIAPTAAARAAKETTMGQSPFEERKQASSSLGQPQQERSDQIGLHYEIPGSLAAPRSGPPSPRDAAAAPAMAPEPVRAPVVALAADPAMKPSAVQPLDLFSQSSAKAQRFARTAHYRRNFNSPSPLEVLNSFQLENNGSWIRIVDTDGSIYEGTIHTAPPRPGPDTGAVAVPSVALDQSEPPSVLGPQSVVEPSRRSFFFTVQGTNRTLNQTVVFNGKYLVTHELDQRKGTSEDGYSGPRAGTGSSVPTQNRLPAAVQGQAVIGGTNRLEIRALATDN